MIGAERDLQIEVMTRLSSRAWPVIALPIPNGIWLPARSEGERVIVARLISRMKAEGMLVPGAPDLVLCWQDGAALVELKRPRSRDLFGRVSPAGRPSVEQTEIANRAAQLGIRHVFVTSWDELRQRLGEWGVHG